jgi:hypothetical protein
MGEVIYMSKRTKGGESKGRSLRGQVLDSLEGLKTIHGPAWSRWRLRKRDPDDRAFLIQLARNLAEILDELPRGKRAKALESARGSGSRETGDANKYVTRVALSATRMGTPEALVKRLTPSVSRYIAVARAVGSIVHQQPEYYLGRLFRDTPLDPHSPEQAVTTTPAWAGDLATVLQKVCASVSRRYQLSTLFDRMLAANIHATDNGRTPEYELSSWVSETFGEGGSWWSADLESWCVWERTEDGTPWSGLPFFVPRVRLFTETYQLGIGPAHLDTILDEPGREPPDASEAIQATLEFRLETWLAICPDRPEPDEPSQTGGYFLLHPSAELITAPRGRQIWEIAATDAEIQLYVFQSDTEAVGGELWKTDRYGAAQFQHRPARFMRWFAATALPEYGSLVAERGGLAWHAVLWPGTWWLLPVNPRNVERVLGEAGTTGPFHLDFATPATIEAWSPFEHLWDLEDSGLPDLVPRLALNGTAASALQLHFLDRGRESPLIGQLEADALRIKGAFDRTEKAFIQSVDARYAALFRDLDEEHES